MIYVLDETIDVFLHNVIVLLVISRDGCLPKMYVSGCSGLITKANYAKDVLSPQLNHKNLDASINHFSSIGGTNGTRPDDQNLGLNDWSIVGSMCGGHGDNSII